MKTILALALILMMGGVAMGEELFYTGDNYPGGINEDPCERLARSARKVADCMYPHDNAVISFRTPKNADRKSTRLNSSHGYTSYAVFCLKKTKPHKLLATTAPQPARRSQGAT